jgi:hypothetical protein
MLGYFMGTKPVTEQLGDGGSETGPQQYSVFESSNDGGATWTSSTFPRSIPDPNLNALVCPAAQTCYAAGGDLIPRRRGQRRREERAIVDPGQFAQRGRDREQRQRARERQAVAACRHNPPRPPRAPSPRRRPGSSRRPRPR